MRRDVAAAALALVIAGCGSPIKDVPPPQPDFQPVASLQEIMRLQVDPSVDPLWESVGTFETRAGIETRIPATEAEWLELRTHALRLVETANLLRIPGRRAVPPSGSVPGAHIDGVLDHDEVEAAVQREWPRFDAYARGLHEAASAALRATEARDAAALLAAGERMQEACEQCHGHFWYPGDKPPADPSPGAVVPVTNYAPDVSGVGR